MVSVPRYVPAGVPSGITISRRGFKMKICFPFASGATSTSGVLSYVPTNFRFSPVLIFEFVFSLFFSSRESLTLSVNIIASPGVTVSEDAGISCFPESNWKLLVPT